MSVLRRCLLSALFAVVFLGVPRGWAQAAPPPAFDPALIQAGRQLFQQNCAFCHGRDAGGGETGPDLTRSALVAADHGGDKINAVVRSGRPDKGMPKFEFSDAQLDGLVAFIHTQAIKAKSPNGGRRGVDAADLLTGSVAAGEAFFNGAGHCTSCHAASGDMAGIGNRLQGLKLEERLLYPWGAPATLTVTLPSGETVTGRLAHRDEFTVALRDASGWYRSWPVSQVHYTVAEPAEAHANLLDKYTDADIHNLIAYLHSLRQR
ncbi:MAG: c-type cytochrome [Terriglobales bacterium]